MPSTDFDFLIKKIQEVTITPSFELKLEDFIARYLLNKFREYLSPDSDPYFSSLNPIFSIELEYSPKRVELLKVLSLRDGVMPLLKFFTLNPIPQNDNTVYIIDSHLSPLVPLAWRRSVLLRSLVVEKEKFQNRFNQKIIFISPSEIANPLTMVQVELDMLSSFISEEDEIYIYLSSVKLRGSGQAQKDEAWGYKILQLINKKFIKNEIKVLNWNEYSSLNLSQFAFHFINPLKYFFTDSYLLHDACQKGAKPLVHDQHPTGYLHKISMNHGFILHQGFKPYNQYGNEQLMDIIEEMKCEKIDLKKNEFCSPEFSSWALDVAKSIYFSSAH